MGTKVISLEVKTHATSFLRHLGLLMKYQKLLDEFAMLFDGFIENNVSLRLLRQWVAGEEEDVFRKLRFLLASFDKEMGVSQMIDEIVIGRCLELDKLGNFQIYLIDAHPDTHQLMFWGTWWNSYNNEDRARLVKHGNFFLSKEEVRAAIDRALGN